MSRSVKKTLGHKDRNPWAKNQANRKVRREGDIAIQSIDEDFDTVVPDGGLIKKIYNPWNICDWNCTEFSENEVRAELEDDHGKPWHRGSLKGCSKHHYVGRLIHRQKGK